MASIEKRGKNTWRLTVELGTGPNGERLRERKTIKIEDKSLLRTTKKLREYLEEEWLKFKMEVESGVYIKPEKMTFAAFVEEWRTKYAEKKLSPLTCKTYLHHIHNHILPSLGHKRLDEIKPLHLVTLINDLQEPGARKDGSEGKLSGYTVVYIYNVLRNLFNVAMDWKLIPANPMDGVQKPVKEKRKMDYYDADEAREVIKCLFKEPLMWRMFILGSMLGGFRRGELLALEWSDIDFENQTIHIHKSISLVKGGQVFEKGTKNDEDRFVDMPSWYMDELKKYHKEWKKQRWENAHKWEGGEREYLFHSGTGKPLYHTTPTSWWNDFVKRHGLRKIRLHDLRHSSATLLIEAGAHLKAIQERLGHKQYQTTADIYAHVTKRVSRELADKFDAFDPKKNML